MTAAYLFLLFVCSKPAPTELADVFTGNMEKKYPWTHKSQSIVSNVKFEICPTAVHWKFSKIRFDLKTKLYRFIDYYLYIYAIRHDIQGARRQKQTKDYRNTEGQGYVGVRNFKKFWNDPSVFVPPPGYPEASQSCAEWKERPIHLLFPERKRFRRIREMTFRLHSKRRKVMRFYSYFHFYEILFDPFEACDSGMHATGGDGILFPISRYDADALERRVNCWQFRSKKPSGIRHSRSSFAYGHFVPVFTKNGSEKGKLSEIRENLGNIPVFPAHFLCLCVFHYHFRSPGPQLERQQEHHAWNRCPIRHHWQLHGKNQKKLFHRLPLAMDSR